MKSLKKILVAEDEEDIQLIIKIALETVSDFNVRLTSSGKEALEILEEFDPDLLLLDVMMPEMEGPVLLAEIRKQKKFSNLPAVFLTAKGEQHELTRLLNFGALAVINKPFDPMALGSKLQEIWKAHNE